MPPRQAHPSTGSWYTYIVLCGDGSLYTGVTTDPARRLAEHNSARGGARYTRSRRPVRLVYLERQPGRAAACRREWAIKGLSATAKKALVAARHGAADCSPPELMA